MGLTNVWKYGMRWPLKKSFITDMKYGLVKIVVAKKNYDYFFSFEKKKLFGKGLLGGVVSSITHNHAIHNFVRLDIFVID